MPDELALQPDQLDLIVVQRAVTLGDQWSANCENLSAMSTARSTMKPILRNQYLSR
jgi:hypothetical protein